MSSRLIVALIVAGAVFLAVLCAALAAVFLWLRERDGAAEPEEAAPEPREEEAPPPPAEPDRPARIVSGKLHHIGRRPSQEDSLGVEEVPGGVFAILADGMGGLAGGEQASQTAVFSLLRDASGKTAEQIGDQLPQLLARANQEASGKMEGTGGSTLVAVAAEQDRFRWISVGDSRIYLFRAGLLTQLNREHVYEEELLLRAVNGEISFEEVRSDPQRRGLTSYLGMGALRHLDRSAQPVAARRGDRVVLMSDGVFHTVPEEGLCGILRSTPDPAEAAAAIGAAVLDSRNPRQDNFTAVILDYQ